MVFSVVSTGVHFAHNFVMAEDYPPVWPFFPNALAYRVGIVVFWPLLTYLGIRAFRRYRAGKTRGVPSGLIAFGLAGAVSPLHFTGGVPQIPPFFMATIFTDALSGLLLFGFAGWLVYSTRSAARRPAAA
jgi:hypothetical protein